VRRYQLQRELAGRLTLSTMLNRWSYAQKVLQKSTHGECRPLPGLTRAKCVNEFNTGLRCTQSSFCQTRANSNAGHSWPRQSSGGVLWRDSDGGKTHAKRLTPRVWCRQAREGCADPPSGCVNEQRIVPNDFHSDAHAIPIPASEASVFW